MVISCSIIISQKTPVSKYNIVTNTKGIKQQRPDRINVIMDMLERNDYVKTSSNITYYQISENGMTVTCFLLDRGIR